MADLLATLAAGNDEFYEEIIRENLDKRILVLNSEIDESVLENYILYILKWNRQDKEACIPVDKRKVITIYINSPGGSNLDGSNFINVFNNYKSNNILWKNIFEQYLRELIPNLQQVDTVSLYDKLIFKLVYDNKQYDLNADGQQYDKRYLNKLLQNF